MGPWNILCDFDGTIAIEDVTDALLERFAHPDWQLLERAWRDGRIGSAECMAGQVALLEASREELDAQLATLDIDPAFPEFAAAAQAAGAALWVVSDGLDYAIRAILARHGLDGLPMRANHLVPAGPRRWRLETPFADPGCRVSAGHCKCTGVTRSHAEGRKVLLVGDGASDFCVAAEADHVFAKHRLIEHCRRADIPHTSIVGFADALALLPELVAGRLEGPRHAPAAAAAAR